MEVETYARVSRENRIYQRLKAEPRQPGRKPKVCIYYRAGRCNRHPCPFLHTADQLTSQKQGRHQNLVWRNPNSCASSPSGCVESTLATRPSPNSCAGSPSGCVESTLATRPSAVGKANCREKSGEAQELGKANCREKSGETQILAPAAPMDECGLSVGDSFSLLNCLKGHKKVITSIALPSGSVKLYSGSKDGSIKAWDCHTGACVQTFNTGHEVGCMISNGPWLFVGIPYLVKAWNTETDAEMNLAGPAGQVHALAAADDMLFAGTQDGQILVWKFNAVKNCFEQAASLVGHQLAVISLVVGCGKLYSSSMDSTIKVWEVATLECVQILGDHTEPVTSLLCCDTFLISGSLDCSVKFWACNAMGQIEAIYTHLEEHGVLWLCGVSDSQGKSVLLCSLQDKTIRLYDLPTLAGRGKIFSKREVSSIVPGPTNMFFTGDGDGDLKVWLMSEKKKTEKFDDGGVCA